MATKTDTPKTPKTPKQVVPVAERVMKDMKRAALNGKITVADLEEVATLAGFLKTFVK